ncbi:MAG: PocR ligand-binding domain-containing protein [Ignavibacteria bacterium]
MTGNEERGTLPEEFGFADLVDVPELQGLMESFHQLTGVANAIIDLQGAVIAHAGWQSLCTRFHRVNPETRRRCIESDTALAGSMTRGEHFALYRCLNGLVDTASPIVVGGRHLANVFTGQFFVAPPDLEFFRRQAAEFGFDEAEYLSAVREVPVIAQERVEVITGIYARLAQILATNGMDRLRQVVAEGKLEEANRGLEQRTRELEAANRELEEFSYSMSHDMRTPLRAIDGFARILAEEHAGQLDDEGRRLLGVVRSNALRMGCLIDDILRFLRVGRHRLSCGDVDMAALVHDVMDELRAGAAGRRIRVKIGALPHAWGDADMLRRVMLNLLSNAIKFSPQGAEVVVEIGGEAKAGENEYYVRDHGVGFDMRYADKLFRVFERVHPTGQFEGSAVGLAVVKRIVGRHGGRVWAEGKSGAGATFHFALPRKGE